jgi:acyl dehydratase
MNGRKRLFHYTLVFVGILLLASGCTDNGSDNPEPPPVDQQATSEMTVDEKTVEWKTVYPGVYDAEEQALFDITKEYLSGDSEVLMGKLAAQLAGKTQIGDMKLNHALPPIQDTPTTESLVAAAEKVYPLNPLYTDPAYAGNTKYKDIIAASITVQPGFGFAYIPKGTDVWISSDDPALGRGLDHELTFHKPIYAGDTLSGVLTSQTITDITDPGGSKVRKFRCVGTGEVYNQDDELVISAFYSGIETFKIFQDRSMAEYYDGPLTIAVNKPDGYWDRIRERHYYTDGDWEYIKELWQKEKIRGAETRYWEDVNIGDEPIWTVDGPFEDAGRTTEHYLVREILMGGDAEDIAAKLSRDENGIYRLKDKSVLNTGGPPPGMPGELAQGRDGMPEGREGGAPGQGGMPEGREGNAPGGQMGMAPGKQASGAASDDPKVRSSFQNTIGAQYATRIVTNWMGDDGWMHKFAWRLAFSLDVGRNQFPEDFDRPSYLYKVPYLVEQGKFMLTHGFEGDLAITKAYVCDKYIKDRKHYVDLVVWLETIDGEVWAECYAVVELPSKEKETS